jgi:hypothetical protein
MLPIRERPPAQILASSVTILQIPTHVIGSPEWFASVTRWVRVQLKVAESDCAPIAHKTPHMRKMVEDQGLSWDTFCREQLEADPRWVAKIEEGVDILEGLGHVGPISKEAAFAAAAAMAKPAEQHGGSRPGAGRKRPNVDSSNQGRDVNLDSKRRDSEYLTARIARDRPDILERMKAGEFASVRKAAIEAGIAPYTAAFGTTPRRICPVYCRLHVTACDAV